MSKQLVRISVGAGTKPIEVEWKQGDTVATVLKRADVKMEEGRVATLGKKKVKNPEKTTVSAGDLIVVEGQPRNGC
ncbi:hypothetical protein FWD07_01280 [Candidatus Saccharibacteria bacterium]|nr:hypothetical protein [Candidatus Saccharibacteria bacterium]